MLEFFKEERTPDELAFNKATGLDLRALVWRHIEGESRDQIWEWISTILRKTLWSPLPGVWIHAGSPEETQREIMELADKIEHAPKPHPEP